MFSLYGIMVFIYTIKDKIPLFLFFFLQISIHTIHTVGTRTTNVNVNTKTLTVDDTSFDCSSLEKSKSFHHGLNITLPIMQCCKSQRLTK